MRGGDRGQGRSRHPVKREKGSRTHPNSYQAPSGARCTRVRRGSRRVRTHALLLLLLIWEKELGGKMFAQRPVCKRLSRLRSPCPRLGNDPVSLASRWTSTLRRGHRAERHSGSLGAHDSRVPGVGRTPTPPGESPGCRGPRRPTSPMAPDAAPLPHARLQPASGWAARQGLGRGRAAPASGGAGAPHLPTALGHFGCCRGSAQPPSSGDHLQRRRTESLLSQAGRQVAQSAGSC